MAFVRPVVALMLLALSFPAFAADPVADAAALLAAKDPRATAAIEGLVKSQPDNAAVRILEARLRLQQDKAAKAVDAAEKAVALAPADAQAHYWLGNSYGSRIGQVGMLSKAMMAPRLRDAFERAVQLDPGLDDARASLVEYYLQAPAIAGGSVDKARAHANHLLGRDAPRGQYALGRVAMQEKKPADASRHFVAAHTARPDNATYRMMAGLSLQETKQWDQAFALFEAWTRQDPKSATAWYQLGRTSALSGQRLDQGAAALERYLTLPAVPGLAPPHHAWYRLGQVQAHAGDKAAARRSFEQAIKGDSGFADARKALAEL